MEEKEIIQILKDNKVEGRPYCWMPRDVRIWIDEHYRECAYLNKHGAWDTSLKYINHSSDITMTDIFCLLENYIQPRSSGEWVEFEIDQKGNFHRFMNGDMHYFFWANWNVFLTEAYSFGYTAFGGWQYKDSDSWYMTPQIESFDAYSCFTTSKDEIPPKPAIPIKIRFWREKQ